MTITIIARTGLRCALCSEVAQAELTPASVVEVEPGRGLCDYHARKVLGEERLVRVLTPEKPGRRSKEPISA